MAKRRRKAARRNATGRGARADGGPIDAEAAGEPMIDDNAANGGESGGVTYPPGYVRPPGWTPADNLTPYKFRPGQSGNPAGRPKKQRTIEKAIRDFLDQGLEGKDLYEAMAKVGVKKALLGDFKFWQEVINRVEGKVPDRLSGPDGEPLTINIFNTKKK